VEKSGWLQIYKEDYICEESEHEDDEDFDDEDVDRYLNGISKY
jgi:hypothetical protein